MIREAEGQAEAILKVQQATADGLRMIRQAGADEAVLTLKSLETFEKVADGRSTKNYYSFRDTGTRWTCDFSERSDEE